MTGFVAITLEGNLPQPDVFHAPERNAPRSASLIYQVSRKPPQKWKDYFGKIYSGRLAKKLQGMEQIRQISHEPIWFNKDTQFGIEGLKSDLDKIYREINDVVVQSVIETNAVCKQQN